MFIMNTSLTHLRQHSDKVVLLLCNQPTNKRKKYKTGLRWPIGLAQCYNQCANVGPALRRPPKCPRFDPGHWLIVQVGFVGSLLQSGFQMTVESYNVITLVLVSLVFPIDSKNVE